MWKIQPTNFHVYITICNFLKLHEPFNKQLHKAGKCALCDQSPGPATHKLPRDAGDGPRPLAPRATGAATPAADGRAAECTDVPWPLPASGDSAGAHTRQRPARPRPVTLTDHEGGQGDGC